MRSRPRCPAPSPPSTGGGGRNTALEVIDSVVEAIVRFGAARLEVPAQPPHAHHPHRPRRHDRRQHGWHAVPRPPRSGPRRLTPVRRLGPSDPRRAPPARGSARPAGVEGVWMARCTRHGAEGGLVPLDEALRAADARSSIAHEWARIERIFPAFARSRQQRGQVVLTQGEAWDFMTGTGPLLAVDRFRRARPRAVAPRREAVAAPVRRGPRRVDGRAPTRSAPCRGACTSTTSSSRRPTSPASWRRRSRCCCRAASGSRSTASTSRRPRPRSPSASRSPS